MTRFSGWTVAGIVLAMLLGTLKAIGDAQLARSTRATRRLARRFPAGWFET